MTYIDREEVGNLVRGLLEFPVSPRGCLVLLGGLVDNLLEGVQAAGADGPEPGRPRGIVGAAWRDAVRGRHARYAGAVALCRRSQNTLALGVPGALRRSLS